jgi:hypothetical protein
VAGGGALPWRPSEGGRRGVTRIVGEEHIVGREAIAASWGVVRSRMTRGGRGTGGGGGDE